MNPCIIELFSDRNATTKFTLGLPQAFERASLELPGGNPAVDFLREHAITGFFKGYFGDRAKIPAEGNKREFDVDICGHQLSIKTVGNDPIDRINRYSQGSPRMLLQKKHPDIDPRVLILEPIEVCSLLNRKKLNAQEIMGRTHGIARGADERVVSHLVMALIIMLALPTCPRPAQYMPKLSI